MSDEELKKQLVDSRRELMELRFNFAVARSLPNPARVGRLKRNVARILTVTQERAQGKATQKASSGRKKKK
ncbi:MAG: 50S ribosomal protein L29 [Leptospirales bacterium]|nr:50S ribosomal protein L29 [Leptospirales bacterium]